MRQIWIENLFVFVVSSASPVFDPTLKPDERDRSRACVVCHQEDARAIISWRGDRKSPAVRDVLKRTRAAVDREIASRLRQRRDVGPTR